ncbi:solute carrier family 49 member A3 [Lampris incognitus]|uniref:solute carrier family 49 member A3 n=1 Tax=Lampris incognitus TaxID=2546036 RepID=UPI0024B49F81|nr:solute carrier family 49 member A3 [Lampris incognitus]
MECEAEGGPGDNQNQNRVSVAHSKPGQEREKLLVFRVYKRRWLVLLLLCLLNCSNSMLWLTFAPVADQSAQYLQVSLDQINWLSMVFMVVAIPLSLGTTWMLDTLGLRITLVLGSWVNMLGALLRFIGASGIVPQGTRYLIVMSGQTVCALAQPLVIFAPTKLAALWFPEHQRATANTIASMSNPLGVLFANIFSPMIASGSYNKIPFLLLVYAILASIICFLATTGIRSSGPPTPPSASAESSSSEPFLLGIKLLLKNKAYMILLLCFGSGIAVFTCFSTLLEQILCVRGYTTDFAGLCGALFIIFGVVGAGILGLYVDKTKKFIEATKVNMSFSALACIAFSLVSQMRGQKAAVAVVCSLFGFFGFSIYPIAMELSVECSYPVGEATSAGLIFISGQIQSVLYIILVQTLTKPITDVPFSTCSTADLSWRVSVLVMAGLCSVFTCGFNILFSTTYKRLEAEAEATQGTKQTNGLSIRDCSPGTEAQYQEREHNEGNSPQVSLSA